MPVPRPRRSAIFPVLLPVLLPAAMVDAHAEVSPGAPAGPDISFEGLLQADWHRYGGDWNGSDHDVRRAELILKGKGPGNLDWVAGHDVRGRRWLDVNARFRSADGRQSLRTGQFKQPNSLEELSSTRSNDFISKAAATNAFAISRRLGAGWSMERDGWSLAASRFGRELTSGQGEGAGIAARATWAPLRNDRQVLHFGLSHARRDAPDAGIRLHARPNADLSDTRIIDTGVLADARRQHTLGTEVLWIRGSLKVQAEWFESTVQRETAADFDASGGYASILWNPGGQTWRYRSGLPETPDDASGRRGLWQIGLRHDRLDLDDAHPAHAGDVAGGRMKVWTLGLNWYWREHTKLALNHVVVASRHRGADMQPASDNPRITELRAQLHW